MVCRVCLASRWLFGLMSFAVSAQTFDIASMRPSARESESSIGPQPGGRLVATGLTLQTLLSLAFSVPPNRIVGAPKWVSEDRFDIQAIVGPPVSPKVLEDFLPYLKALILDRCSIKYVVQERETPIFQLKVGPKGHKLKLNSSGEEIELRAGRGFLRGKMVPIDTLSSWLSDRVGRPVVNQTGMRGAYDFNLEWAPENRLPDDPPRGINGERPPLFEAVPEQLGLLLQSARAKLPYIVIEKIVQPSPN